VFTGHCGPGGDPLEASNTTRPPSWLVSPGRKSGAAGEQAVERPKAALGAADAPKVAFGPSNAP